MGAPAQGYTNPNVASDQQVRDDGKDILMERQLKYLNALIAHLQIITNEDHVIGEGDEIDGSN